MLIAVACAGDVPAAAYLMWRYLLFFRDPPRTPPAAEGILSPADGIVA